MSRIPFRAASNLPLNVTVTATSVAYLFPVGNSSGNTVLISNNGNAPVYFAWGGPGVVAAVPTWDGTDGSHISLPGSIMVLSKPENNNFPGGVTHIAVIRDGADSDQQVSIAVGEGD